MTQLRFATVAIAMVSFAVSAILGVSIPPEKTGWWFLFLALSLIVLYVVGRLGKNGTISLTVVELIAQLLTAFSGGLFSGQLAQNVATARSSGAEGFIEIANNLILSQGIWLAAFLAMYGLMFVLQFGLLDFVERRRP